MKWTDQGIILSSRKQGEGSAVVTLLTESHGRHAGLVKGAFGKSNRSIYMPGNRVEAVWQARLPEHLGHWRCEVEAAYAPRIMQHRQSLAVLNYVTALLLATLAEREPHPVLYEACESLLCELANQEIFSSSSFLRTQESQPSGITKDKIPACAEMTEKVTAEMVSLIHFELLLLQELGFGLDLRQCAATGQTDDLCYVSPRSGRAVSQVAGEPYKDKLLLLPEFLVDETEAVSPEGCLQAGKLTGYFLQKWLFAALEKPMPKERASAYQRLLPNPVI